jgi:hypothetical protein
LPEEIAIIAKVKKWAEDYLPNDNELRDTILSEEQDVLPRWEAMIKVETYSRMLDAKVKRMAETE